MAQLPPRIGNNVLSSSPNWPNLAAHHGGAPTSPFPFPAMSPGPPPSGPLSSWFDEFLDFSSAKRSLHRRAVSDSIAFLEGEGGSDFDRLDEELLTSMFAEEVPPPLSSSGGTALASSPSTPSEQNSGSEEKPVEEKQPVNETDEAKSECNVAQPAAGAEVPLVTDPRRVKRILANRQSAQRSRMKKLQYISELEQSVTKLQSEGVALSPRVAFLDHQRSLLALDNTKLKQRIAALAQDDLFKDAYQEALKEEIDRLRQAYQQQTLETLEKMASESSVGLAQDLLN